jgi:hypothetical protein
MSRNFQVCTTKVTTRGVTISLMWGAVKIATATYNSINRCKKLNKILDQFISAAAIHCQFHTDAPLHSYESVSIANQINQLKDHLLMRVPHDTDVVETVTLLKQDVETFEMEYHHMKATLEDIKRQVLATQFLK